MNYFRYVQAKGNLVATKDFFISYNKADKAWAEWIAWQLEQAGKTTVIQAWDFRPGGNFILEMQDAAVKCERTIAILSPEYLQSLYTQTEWAAALASDPTGTKRTLLPVRVRECELQGMLQTVIYIDLVNLAEDVARQRILEGVGENRAKPIVAPDFPGMCQPPRFPGDIAIENPQPYESTESQDTILMSNSDKPSINRSVSIGGSVHGSIITTGDHNKADLHIQQVTLPSPASVNIQTELASLRVLLQTLETPDRKKIENALSEAEDELTKAEPDKQEIGKAVERAFDYAKKAGDFIKLVDAMKPHVSKAVSWLGAEWHQLLEMVGLTV